MPFVIYIFALSAFALGLAEFVPIGLTDAMAGTLGVDIAQTGTAITAYALGATFSAPILTAMTANWSRKRVMLVTTLVFAAGSLFAATATNLHMLLVARFVAGIGHGLFLAVASSTAARLAGSKKSGSAVAVVFGGFTLAMAIGVPVSTYLGATISWRPVLAAIGAFGALGFVGLLIGMRDPINPDHGTKQSTMTALKALFNGKLLAGALVTVFGYAGSFAAYTYIAPMLTQVTKLSANTVSIFMMIYGVLAAVGNVMGGKMTDRLGVNRASTLLIAGIALAVLGMWLFVSSPVSMAVLVALLGLFTFAAVPALQARLISVAEAHIPNAHGVAAGLNIAGFNSGIALGSLLGGVTIDHVGIASTGATGAIASAIGLALLLTQVARDTGGSYRSVRDAGH
ncbi:MFS transporter [Burkholderia sp. Ac-20345]|uniref:MFS transporter n=1 Tax=Burkholderia sp. Ac-20345 TaxID=2703891 RepID=UPI0004DA66F7|nr:MFS transporter [Burkholderia sp. Ac-20345]KER67926.1 MFS transporter [Burkholderia cepacia]MBN3779363.1 MFS transporter [Burkholderia sp. Ac-20345]